MNNLFVVSTARIDVDFDTVVVDVDRRFDIGGDHTGAGGILEENRVSAFVGVDVSAETGNGIRLNATMVYV